MNARRSPRLLCRISLVLVCTGFIATTQAQAPPSDAPSSVPEPPAPEGSAPATQKLDRVEISGDRSSEARRNSTAWRIIIGREEIERFGDSSITETLRRLPGITTGGRPWRGGEPRMRGMGSGCTQILVNGERMPRGFSLATAATSGRRWRSPCGGPMKTRAIRFASA